jgi:4-amino-4-deoxy-L-arabinose transferase-like glycosyltransferase
LTRAVLLFVLALVHRAILISWTSTIASDSAYYLWTADFFRQGDWDRGMDGFGGTHPLYPILTALAGSLLGTTVAGAYAVSALASSFCVVGVYLLARPHWNERCALGAALLAVLHPTLSSETSGVMQTSLFLCLFVWTLAFLSMATEGWRVGYPLAGLAAGLAYLTRPEGLLLVPIGAFAGAWALVTSLRSRSRTSDPTSRGPVARIALGFGVAAAVFLLAAGPYVLWIHSRTGKWAVTTRPSAAFLLNAIGHDTPHPPNPFPSLPPAPENHKSEALPTGPPSGAPGPVPPPAIPTPAPTRSLWSDTGAALKGALYGPLIPFVILGFASGRREGLGWKVLLFALGVAILVAIPPILLVLLSRGAHGLSHRYFLPASLVLLPWAAQGLLGLGDWFRRGPSRWRTNARRAVLVLQIAAFALLAGKSLGPRRSKEAAFVQAGRWVRELPEDALRKAWVSGDKLAWYCGVTFQQRTRPGETGPVIEEFRAECRRRGVALVVVDEKSLAKFPPDFLAAVESLGFREVTRFPTPPDRRLLQVTVYRR